MGRGRSSSGGSRGGSSSRSSSRSSFRSSSCRSSSYRSSSYRPSSYRSSSYRSSFSWPIFINTTNSSSELEQVIPSKKYKKVRNKKATLIVGLIFACLFVLFFSLALANNNERSYGTIIGTATVVDSAYMYGDKYYYTTYNFVLDGKEYSTESQIGWTQLPDIPIGKEDDIDYVLQYYLGKQFELYYLKDNPYVIYEIEEGLENLPSQNSGYIIGSIFMFIVAVSIFAIGINRTEEDTEYAKEYERLLQEQELKRENKLLCKYCGTKVDKDIHKCPSCGAPVK